MLREKYDLVVHTPITLGGGGGGKPFTNKIRSKLKEKISNWLPILFHQHFFPSSITINLSFVGKLICNDAKEHEPMHWLNVIKGYTYITVKTRAKICLAIYPKFSSFMQNSLGVSTRFYEAMKFLSNSSCLWLEEPKSLPLLSVQHISIALKL